MTLEFESYTFSSNYTINYHLNGHNNCHQMLIRRITWQFYVVLIRCGTFWDSYFLPDIAVKLRICDFQCIHGWKTNNFSAYLCAYASIISNLKKKMQNVECYIVDSLIEGAFINLG